MTTPWFKSASALSNKIKLDYFHTWRPQRAPCVSAKRGIDLNLVLPRCLPSFSVTTSQKAPCVATSFTAFPTRSFCSLVCCGCTFFAPFCIFPLEMYLFFSFFPESVCDGFFVKNICRTTYHLHLHLCTSTLSPISLFTSAHRHLCSSSHRHVYIYILICTSTSLLIFTSSHRHLCSCSYLHIHLSHLHILTSTSHIFTSRSS